MSEQNQENDFFNEDDVEIEADDNTDSDDEPRLARVNKSAPESIVEKLDKRRAIEDYLLKKKYRDELGEWDITFSDD